MNAPLAPALSQILKKELALGNEIAEETTWLPNCVMLVMLKRKFHKEYSLSSGVSFREIDYYHYWFAEYDYESGEGTHSLACGFE